MQILLSSNKSHFTCFNLNGSNSKLVQAFFTFCCFCSQVSKLPLSLYHRSLQMGILTGKHFFFNLDFVEKKAVPFIRKRMEPSLTSAFSDACTQVCDKNCSTLPAINWPLWGWAANISDDFRWDINSLAPTAAMGWHPLCGHHSVEKKDVYNPLIFLPQTPLFKEILLLNGWFESYFIPKSDELNYGVTYILSQSWSALVYRTFLLPVLAPQNCTFGF